MGDTINWGFFKRHFWGGLLRHQQTFEVRSAPIYFAPAAALALNF
jgi:hypothetical protein